MNVILPFIERPEVYPFIDFGDEDVPLSRRGGWAMKLRMRMIKFKASWSPCSTKNFELKNK